MLHPALDPRTPCVPRELLGRTNRTLASSVARLPEPTRNALNVAGLLFGIIETLETADEWPRTQRVAALYAFVAIVRHGDAAGARNASRGWRARNVTTDEARHELLVAFPDLVSQIYEWPRSRARTVRAHAAHAAEASAQELLRADPSHDPVAPGIFGELVTALFLCDAPELASAKETLTLHARAFGEGLAQGSLEPTHPYIEALAGAGAPPGLLAFATAAAA